MSEQSANASVDAYEYSRRKSESPYDPCAVLGVDRAAFFNLDAEAQSAEAKRRFRAKAREVHPDTTQDPTEKVRLEQEFKEANQAYAFLTNPDIKAQEKQFYDAEVELQKKRAAEAKLKEERAREAQTPSQPPPEPQPVTPSRNRDVRDADMNWSRDVRPHFRTRDDEQYWNTFVNFYRHRTGVDTRVGGSVTQLVTELKTQTQQLSREHETPRRMFNLYIKAVADLAKMIVLEGQNLTSETFQASPEYQLVESYQQLLAGSQSVIELFTEHSLALFTRVTEANGEVHFVLKPDLSNDDLTLIDIQLRVKVADKMRATPRAA